MGEKLAWVLAAGGKVGGALAAAVLLVLLSLRHFAEPLRSRLLGCAPPPAGKALGGARQNRERAVPGRGIHAQRRRAVPGALLFGAGMGADLSVLLVPGAVLSTGLSIWAWSMY